MKSIPHPSITYYEQPLTIIDDNNSVFIDYKTYELDKIEIEAPINLNGAQTLCFDEDNLPTTNKGCITLGEKIKLDYYFISKEHNIDIKPKVLFPAAVQFANSITIPDPNKDIRLFILNDTNDYNPLKTDYLLDALGSFFTMPSRSKIECPLNYFMFNPKEHIVSGNGDVGTGKKLKRGTVTIVHSKKNGGSGNLG